MTLTLTFFVPFVFSIRLIHLKPFTNYTLTIELEQITRREILEKEKSGFRKWIASKVLSQTFSSLKTTLQPPALWSIVDIIYVTILLFFSFFYSDTRESAISSFNGWSFWFCIFGIVSFCVWLTWWVLQLSYRRC